MIVGMLLILLCSLTWSGIFYFLNSKNKISAGENIILAVAIAPVSLSFVLWLLMVAFPGKMSHMQMFVCVTTIFAVIGIICLRQIIKCICACYRDAVSFVAALKYPSWCSSLFFTAIAAVVVLLMFWALINPIRNFDMIEYMLTGDMFFSSRKIVYDGAFYNSANGFLYRAYHSFVFSLFAAWGNIITSLFGAPQDWFFKFISIFYWLILNLYVFRILIDKITTKMELVSVFCAVAVLNFIPVTGDFLYFYGLDFFRVTLFTITICLLWRYLNSQKWGLSITLGLFAAASMLAHGLQTFFTALIMSTLVCLLWSSHAKNRFLQLVVIACIIIVIGGSHYIMMTFWGDGWVLKYDLGGRGLMANVNTPIPELAGYTNPSHSLILQMFAGSLILQSIMCIAGVCRKIKAFVWREDFIFIIPLLVYIVVLFRFSDNYRYSYMVYPLFILGNFIFWQKVVRDQKKYCRLWLSVMVIQVLVTLFFCFQLLNIQRRDATDKRIEAVNSGSGNTACLAENCNPFDMIDRKYGEVMFVSKNKYLYRQAPYQVYYLYVDIPRYLVLREKVYFLSANADDWLAELAQLHIRQIIVEKTNVTKALRPFLNFLQKNSIVLYENNLYAIYRLIDKNKGL